MSVFNYVAKDGGGRIVRSSVEAATRFQALSDLRGQGLTVVDLFDMAPPPAAAAAAPGARRRTAPRLLARGVSRTDVAVFCRQLAIAVNAGLPVREALDSIADELENGTLKAVVESVVKDLHEGSHLSEALSKHARVFSPLFVALIKAAEESGSMPQTLNRLSFYLEHAERLARKIRSITAYPLFVLGFFCVVCVIMTVYIVPQFERIFAESGAELPLLTHIVFRLNAFMLDHLLLLALAAAAVAGLAVAYARTPAGRYQIDRLKLSLPFFGALIRKYTIARSFRTLGIMLKGGVPITTALPIMASVSANRVLEAAARRTHDRIIKGRDLSSSLAEEHDFPRLVVRMVAVGEAAGQMPDVMEKVADGYEDQVEGSIMVATSLFEPVVICVFGAVVLVLVMAVYLPIFTLARAVQ